MEEYRKISFLMELTPNIYRYLKGLKTVALLYATFLGVMVVLSLFLQCGFIKFFIDCMMGWTLLSIPFVAIIIVALDKKFMVRDFAFTHKLHHKELTYKLSMIWGIILCIGGLVALYYSNSYKKYYAFQCQDFYLEENAGVYHILKGCENIGLDEGGNPVENPSIVEIKGKDLLETDYELCVVCQEWAKEAQAETATYQYRRP